MISSPQLVHEKIWLDKPKYDAAERRYYERLAKSSESAKVANSTNITDQQDKAGLTEGKGVQASFNNSCSVPDKVSPTKIHQDKLNNGEDSLIKEENIVVSSIDDDKTKVKEDDKACCATKHDLSNLNLKESVCCTLVHRNPKVEDVSVKKVEVLPDISQQPASESGAPQIIANRSKSVLINKTTENESSHSPQANKVDVGSKTEKPKKTDVHNKDNTFSKSECLANIKAETGEISCSKVKGQNKGKVTDDKSVKQEFVPDKGSCIDPVSDVVKLKGYYLPSKNLSYPSDSLKNKGTNVNTIPEISKITTCFEKSKNSQNNIKKVPLIRAPLPDKQDSVELIIPSDSTNDPQAEDQAKKESKKKKRHKKERQRDKKGVSQNSNSWNSLAGEVAKARQHIKNSLQCIDDIAVTSNTVSVEITNRLNSLEKENLDLKNQVSELVELLKKMDLRIASLEKTSAGGSKSADNKAPAPAPHPKKDDAEDDDGVDLFGSDSEEEDTEAAKIKEQRLAEYAARKAKKPVLIAKSNIILDVKPWDDETNMKELEGEVRKITTDGLVWGASKLVPLAYGIHKLQISCVVEDDKVSVDWLQETIQEIEDYVQSVDIAAFNKV